MNNNCMRVLLPSVLVFLWIPAPHSFAQTKPTVVSTNPPNGATDVDPMLASFSVTFSKPMDINRCGASTRRWPYPPSPGMGESCTWSADKLTMTLTRYNKETPFGSLTKIEVYLGGDGEQGPYLRDAEGNFLAPYYFSFTIAKAPDPVIVQVPADPQKGFSWPYYLYVPITVKKPAVLMVEPNNTGTVSDDPAVHDKSAHELMSLKKDWATVLGVPWLIPTFPRPASDVTLYTHALDRKTIMTTQPGLVRIDIQLIKMVEDARGRLAAAGITVDAKFFMMGASASGSFTSRFVMLHPELVKAASIGSPGWGPIVPVAKWNGQDLPYPEGIADLNVLVGAPFALDAFRRVPLQVYVGDEDLNTDPWWNLANPEVALVDAAFGGVSMYERMPEYEAAYNSVSSSSQFIVIPGFGHYWAPYEYLFSFFERNRIEPPPAPLPKPMLYKLCFPHVASSGEWETEIALTSTSVVPVKGELRTMKAEGGDPTEAVPITIPARGRVELTVSKYFQRPQEIAYLMFLSDSGYLAGYTRFYQPGNRASLSLGQGSNQGWFPKVEKDGWTGVAFVNIGTVPATVALTAYDDSGTQVATTTVLLAPGQKSVGMVDQLFKSDLKNATYCRYSSDKDLLGFTVSGSSDGQMLDGLHALGDYISAKR